MLYLFVLKYINYVCIMSSLVLLNIVNDCRNKKYVGADIFTANIYL